ncbi:hypothetical protein CWI38_0086p0010, partial [Hamiltosporidium tvaerminnensis]
MGIRKYVGSEKQKEKIIKAANRASEVDGVIRECKNDQGIPQPSSYTPSTFINNISIPPSEANTNTKRQEFIRCVLFAVQTRFDRMPRNGWKEIQSYYNEKFSCTETFDEENGERRRIATCLAEPLVVRTRKLPNELVDSTVLDLINRIVGEYADSHVPMTITDIAQVCYDDETQLSSSQTKSLKKIMREFNLDLNKTNDLSEALVKKNELITVYEKKLTMYESRKQFRKENRMFELF